MDSILRCNGGRQKQAQLLDKEFIRSFPEVVAILNDKLNSVRQDFKIIHPSRGLEVAVEECRSIEEEERDEEWEEDVIYLDEALDPICLGVLLFLQEDFTRLFAIYLCCNESRVWRTYGLQFDTVGAQGKRTKFVIDCHRLMSEFSETQTMLEQRFVEFKEQFAKREEQKEGITRETKKGRKAEGVDADFVMSSDWQLAKFNLGTFTGYAKRANARIQELERLLATEKAHNKDVLQELQGKEVGVKKVKLKKVYNKAALYKSPSVATPLEQRSQKRIVHLAAESALKSIEQLPTPDLKVAALQEMGRDLLEQAPVKLAF
jgi:hypothetical protein